MKEITPTDKLEELVEKNLKEIFDYAKDNNLTLLQVAALEPYCSVALVVCPNPLVSKVATNVFEAAVKGISKAAESGNLKHFEQMLEEITKDDEKPDN